MVFYVKLFGFHCTCAYDAYIYYSSFKRAEFLLYTVIYTVSHDIPQFKVIFDVSKVILNVSTLRNTIYFDL